MKLLNIGCGTNFHPSWTNVDMVSQSSHVIACDIRKGLPFSDGSFDGIYHSHLVEHLDSQDAHALMQECIRVLRPGGSIRVVTPDLEGLARAYLDRLEAAAKGDPGAAMDHQWMVIEMIDQMVRRRSGGEMSRYLTRSDPENREFILSRIGQEAEQYWNPGCTANAKTQVRKSSLRNLARLALKARQEIAAVLVWLISGKEGQTAFREGVFRNSGEIHRWLFDRLSLSRLLERSGFTDIRQCTADESRIPMFHMYELDVVNGKARKPDSLFLEASKPV